MIEQTVISEIGKAEDVILGIASVGIDLDGTWVMSGFEFLVDQDSDSRLPW